ncbi:MAG: hypothetical protein N4A33_07305 [Bacteriovoracaceae bacterium]|nr:hypothetical protein [Bacteriovoracaceae bacterium]
MKMLLLVILIGSFSSYGMLDRSMGDWASGGGNALVCFKSGVITEGEVVIDIIDEVKKNNNTIPTKFLEHIDTIELFDLYEAKKKRGLLQNRVKIIEVKKDENFYDYFSRLSDRYKKINLSMAFIVDEGKKLIPDSNIMFHDFAVQYQNDLGEVTLPNNHCIISTMAAQVNFKEHYEVHIDERLFFHPKHSLQSQASLILHELIYAVTRKHYSFKESFATRKVLANLVSKHTSITERSVTESLYNLGLMGDKDTYSNRYGSSSIVMYIKFYLEHFRQNSLTSLNEMMIDQKYIDFKVQFTDFIENRCEYIYDPSQMLDPIFIDIIMKEVKCDEQETLEKFKKKFYTDFYNELKYSFESRLELFQTGLIEESLKKHTFIDQKDLARVQYHVDMWKSASFENSDGMNEFYLKSSSQSEEEFVEEHLWSVLQGTICTSDVNTDISIPELKLADHVCYDPLQLNNIVK